MTPCCINWLRKNGLGESLKSRDWTVETWCISRHIHAQRFISLQDAATSMFVLESLGTDPTHLVHCALWVLCWCQVSGTWPLLWWRWRDCGCPGRSRCRIHLSPTLADPGLTETPEKRWEWTLIESLMNHFRVIVHVDSIWNPYEVHICRLEKKLTSSPHRSVIKGLSVWPTTE